MVAANWLALTVDKNSRVVDFPILPLDHWTNDVDAETPGKVSYSLGDRAFSRLCGLEPLLGIKA